MHSSRMSSTPQRQTRPAGSPQALPPLLARHPYYSHYYNRAAPHGPPPPPRANLRGGSRSLLAVLQDDQATKALLLVPPATLGAEHDLSEAEVDELLSWAAAAVSPLTAPAAPARTLAALFAGSSVALPVPTGLRGLDRLLLGGLRPGFVCELTGPLGCGKTRLALQWAASAVLSGRSREEGGGSQVLWMHTTPPQAFEMQALQLLQQQQHRAEPTATGASPRGEEQARTSESPEPSTWNAVERLRRDLLSMPVPADLDEFRQFHLKYVAHFLTQQHSGNKVRLLVVDSLSQLVHRGHSGLIDTDNVQRQNSIVSLVQDLKQLAARHGLCVLVLTTSSSRSSGGGGGGGEPSAMSGSGDEAPGEFGRMAYHSVNVRMRLEEGLCPVDATAKADAAPQSQQRRRWGRLLRVVKSPLSGPAAFLLTESASGELLESRAATHTVSFFTPCGELAVAVDAGDYQTLPSLVHM